MLDGWQGELDDIKPDGVGTLAGGADPGDPLMPETQAAREPDLERILGLPVVLSVMLADRQMPIEAIVEITVGTIIEFEVPFDSELPLQIGDQTIGHGQAVKAGERFGLRLSHIETVHDRIDAMGKP